MKEMMLFFILFVSMSIVLAQNICEDTDGGFDLYAKGQTSDNEDGGSISLDHCVIRKPNGLLGNYEEVFSCESNEEYPCQVYEGTCSPDNKRSGNTYDCDFGCTDGACLEKPFNDDNKRLFFIPESKKMVVEKGKIYEFEIVVKNNLLAEKYTNELFQYRVNIDRESITGGDCDTSKFNVNSEESFIISENLPFGKNVSDMVSFNIPRETSACNFKINVQTYIGQEEYASDQIEIEIIEDELDMQRKQCTGCFDESNKQCYKIGQRIDERYCDTNKFIVYQNGNKGTCTNNFECLSNNCKENTCKNKGIITQLFSWLGKLFS